MSFENKNIVEQIRLPKSAYFYKKECCFRKDSIGKEVGSIKVGFGQNATSVCVKKGEVEFNMVVFKCPPSTPEFAKDFDNTGEDEWKEYRLGYVVFAEYDEYVVVFKRNAPSLNDFVKVCLKPLDYNGLVGIRVNEDTMFSSLSMDNIGGNEKNVRKRTFWADDLKESLPRLGAGHYALKNIIGKNRNNDKTSLRFEVTMSTSHIHEYNKDDYSLETIGSWIEEMLDNYTSAHTKNSFTEIFAKSESYVDKRDELTPASVVISSSALLNRKLDIVKYKDNTSKEVDQSFDVAGFIDNYIQSFNLKKDNNGKWKSEGCAPHIFVRLLDRRMSIGCTAWNDVYVKFNEEEMSFKDYVNEKKLFSVFCQGEYAYIGGSLFSKNNLIDIKHISEKVLVPWGKLNNVEREKGNNSISSAIEGMVRNEIQKGKYDLLIWEDMGAEFADHIAIGQDVITFFVEKFHDSIKSATDFQDVIGQACKNINNFTPSEKVFKEKVDKWQKNYRGQKNKPRVIMPENDVTKNDIRKQWKQCIDNPFTTKEMALVVNFIEKETLAKIEKKKVRGQVDVQLAWLLSVFVSTCLENNVKPIIYCPENFQGHNPKTKY